MTKLSKLFQALWQAAESEKMQRRTGQGKSSVTIYTNVGRLARFGRLLNWVVKVRGRKIAVAHFPSDISNLPVLIFLLSSPSSTQTETTKDFPCHPALSPARSWEIRSICFLWLSLLLTVPFDLSAFDTVQPLSTTITRSSDTPLEERQSDTAAQVTTIGKRALYVPSKEGEYSSLVLARLFSRRDGVSGLNDFFKWVEDQVKSGDVRSGAGVESRVLASQADGSQAVFLTNILAMLAQLPSLLPDARTHLPRLLDFYTNVLAPRVEGTTGGASNSSNVVTSNGLLRKMAVKARGRWWIAMLETTMGDAGRARRNARGRKVVTIESNHYVQKQGKADVQEEEEEFDPPEGLEEEIERLMDCLSDKVGLDPLHLYLLNSRNPLTLISYRTLSYDTQLQNTFLESRIFFPIVEATIALFSGTPDDPLIQTERGNVIDPGGGSNGDAKWHGLCLALAEMGRRGLIEDDMVGDLLGWAVKALNFDIRRGAHSIGSNVRDAAAYLIWSLARALPPSTIRPFTQTIAQVLVCVACFDREVGIRRAASAAFQEHVGRMGLFPHGIDVLRKTDFYSVSVRRTAFLVSAPQVAIHEEYQSAMLEHLHYITLRHWDPAMRLIGAQSLRLISELNDTLPSQALQLEIEQLGSVELANIHGALAAAYELACLYRARSDQRRLSEIFGSLHKVRASAFVVPACEDAVHVKAKWEVCSRVLDLSMKNRKEEVQVAASIAFGAMSRSGRPAQKQSFAMALGQADYNQTPELLQPVLKCLLGNVSISTKAMQQDVETRRASYISILGILRCTEHSPVTVTVEEFLECYRSFLDGLDDYSTDQRGDVGSWIRITCAQALPLLTRMGKMVDARLSSEACLQAVHGLIKLSVEKLETVRVVAGPALCEILKEHGPMLGLEEIYQQIEAIRDWKDVRSLYTAMGVLLPVQSVQRPVFEGLILSLGGKNLSTQNAAATAITGALQSFSVPHPQLVGQLTHTLLTFGTENLNKQRVFTPVLMAAFELAQAEVWNELSPTSSCSQEYVLPKRVKYNMPTDVVLP
ncbi:hypothetical protein QFC19_005377 [Naganishia cerealis]|uniref:Uncharacterized protein n=1 Tax=Naganishia cerealis TaxID=610337 RepID=A0ACC2VQH5_9TREE|nr:hypothetical protein QFC19_005377 [Naganishia cerealis]